jgi:hypothetical protein
MAGGFRGGEFHHGGEFGGRGFHDRGFRDHDRGRRFFGFGGYYPYYDDYAYYDYPYDDSYYDNGSCYVVQRRVHTTHGWRHQPAQVCN